MAWWSRGESGNQTHSVRSALFNGATWGESPWHPSPLMWALDYLASERLPTPAFHVSWLGFSLANHGPFKSTAPVPLPVAKNLQNQAKQAALSVPVNGSQQPGRQPNLVPKTRKKLNPGLSSQITFSKTELRKPRTKCVFLKIKQATFWTS